MVIDFSKFINSEGIDPNFGIDNIDVNCCDEEGRTPLIFAAQHGYDEAIKELCRHGVNVNHVMEDGVSSLSFAVLYGHDDTVRVLCELGADVNLKDIMGFAPLNYASGRGNDDLIELLCSFGADVKTQINNGSTLIHIAARSGKDKTIKTLNDLGADIDLKDDLGNSPIHAAADLGFSNVVEMLAYLGADTKPLEGNPIENFDHETPIAAGRKKRHDEKFIKRGATELLATSISLKTEEVDVCEDGLRVIGSFLDSEDNHSLSRVPVKKQDEKYERASELLKEYRDGILDRINSGELMVTDDFMDKFFGQMEIRLGPSSIAYSGSGNQLEEKSEEKSNSL